MSYGVRVESSTPPRYMSCRRSFVSPPSLSAWKSLITLNCAFHINGVRGSLKQQKNSLIWMTISVNRAVRSARQAGVGFQQSRPRVDCCSGPQLQTPRWICAESRTGVCPSWATVAFRGSLHDLGYQVLHFPKPAGLMSHIHLGKSRLKIFGKRSLLKKKKKTYKHDWENLLSVLSRPVRSFTSSWVSEVQQ